MTLHINELDFLDRNRLARNYIVVTHANSRVTKKIRSTHLLFWSLILPLIFVLDIYLCDTFSNGLLLLGDRLLDVCQDVDVTDIANFSLDHHHVCIAWDVIIVALHTELHVSSLHDDFWTLLLLLLLFLNFCSLSTLTFLQLLLSVDNAIFLRRDLILIRGQECRVNRLQQACWCFQELLSLLCFICGNWRSFLKPANLRIYLDILLGLLWFSLVKSDHTLSQQVTLNHIVCNSQCNHRVLHWI